MARRHYANTAQPQSLTSAVDQDATTLAVASTDGYPDVPFTIAIDRGTSDEEACLVTALTSNSFTVTRGFDGTTKFSHDVGSPVEHCGVALDLDDANDHIWNTSRDDHEQYLTEERLLATDLSAAPGVSSLPVGTIVMTGRSTAPDSNWRICNGDAVSRSTLSALFAAIGTAYGVGDGVASFNLPDLRGRFPIGKSFVGRTQATETHTLGEDGGEEFHTLTTSELPAHNHTQNAHSHTQGTHRHTGTTGTAGEHTHTVNGGLSAFITAEVDTGHAGRAIPNAGTGAETYTHTDQATYANNGFGSPGVHHAHTFTSNYANPGATNEATATNQATGGDDAHENMPPYLTINFMIRVL
jgi:microcystin-dependent protein